MLYILLLIVLLVGGAVILLLFQNPGEVQLSLFGWHAPSLPVGVLLLAAFLLGALLLYGVFAATAVQEGRELKRLRRRVAELEQAQAQMRLPGIPVQPIAPLLQDPPPIVPMPGITAPLQVPPPQQQE